jgi:hypothetical protein
MIAWLLFALMLATIFGLGLYVGTMTERRYWQHKRAGRYRLNDCDTYTTPGATIRYTYGGKND